MKSNNMVANQFVEEFRMNSMPKAEPEAKEHARSDPAKKEVSPLHFFTGFIAGAVSRSATCPLERIKILRQTSVMAYSKLSIGQTLMEIYRNEGVIGFYKGNGVNVLRASPCAAFEFLFYEIYKSLIIDDTNNRNFSAKLICGALTGVTANTLTYPLDLI